MAWDGEEMSIDNELILKLCWMTVQKRLDGQTYPQSNADERWKKDKRNIKCKCS